MQFSLYLLKEIVMKYMSLAINFSVAACLAISMSSCSAQIRHSQRQQDSVEILEAEGRTEYNERNINETREKAVYDAKINAVRHAAEIFSDADYKSKGKKEALDKIVYEDPDFFIKKYKITSEGQERDSYNINIKVFLYPHKIASSVRAAGLVSPVSGPKAALVIEEKPADSGFSSAFYKDLMKDSIMSLEIMTSDKAGDGSYDSLNAAAADMGAEMYIKAKASAYLLGGGMMSDFSAAAADGSVEVVQVPSGRRLSDISRQGSASDSSKNAALNMAMENLSALLAKDTASRVDPQLKTDPVIKLVFMGLGGLDKAETVKNDLLKMNFKYVSLDSYSAGKAVFSAVTKTQDGQEIASMVLRGDTTGLQLGDVKGKEITFTAY